MKKFRNVRLQDSLDQCQSFFLVKYPDQELPAGGPATCFSFFTLKTSQWSDIHPPQIFYHFSACSTAAEICHKLQCSDLSHFDQMDSRWDFIWILLKTLLHLPRGDACERRAVSEQWILNFWICQVGDETYIALWKSITFYWNTSAWYPCVVDSYFLFKPRCFCVLQGTGLCICIILHLYSYLYLYISCKAHVCGLVIFLSEPLVIVIILRPSPLLSPPSLSPLPLLLRRRPIFPCRNDLDNVCGVRQMRKISVPSNWSNLETTSNLRMK